MGRFSNLDKILNFPEIPRFRENEYCFPYIIKIFNNENTLKKFNDLFKGDFSRPAKRVQYEPRESWYLELEPSFLPSQFKIGKFFGGWHGGVKSSLHVYI